MWLFVQKQVEITCLMCAAPSGWLSSALGVLIILVFVVLMGLKRNVFPVKCSRSVILTRHYRMFLTCWSSLRGLLPGEDECWWSAAVIRGSVSVCFSSTWKWAPVMASFLFSDFLLHTGLLRPQSLFYILHLSMCPSHTSALPQLAAVSKKAEMLRGQRLVCKHRKQLLSLFMFTWQLHL